MSWLVSAKQYIPAVIGEPFGGGYFAGYISHTADGNPTHALIVAPRATGATGTGYALTTNLQWKTTNTTTPGTTSLFDGAANTAAMVTASITNHPAAQFCVNLNIGGFTDWYLPSLYEYEIAYFNLRPWVGYVNSNSTSANTANIYAVPRRDNAYTRNYPPVTHLSLFSTGSEKFSTELPNNYIASTETSEISARIFSFFDGLIGGFNNKTQLFQVRAFRRIAL